MKIYVDAYACPVVRQTEQIAKRHGLSVALLCDTNHVLISDYSEVRVIGAGTDAVDLALINLCKSGDIVVTQDYGVAAMALGKGACAIHQNGWEYTKDNIDRLLMERYAAKKARRAKKKVHLHGLPRRTVWDDERFTSGLERLISRAIT